MEGWDIAPMRKIPLGRNNFRGGGTYVQEWKTSDMRKCKPAGRLHAENIRQYCGTPLLPGEDWSGMNPPLLSTNKKVKGPTTNVLRKENQQKCHRRQEEQGPKSYWSTHDGIFVFSTELPPPGKHCNNMCP